MSTKLRDFWELVNSVANADAEGREFTSCSVLLQRLSKEAAGYGMSLAAVEEDEKRRALLEELAVASRANADWTHKDLLERGIQPMDLTMRIREILRKLDGPLKRDVIR